MDARRLRLHPPLLLGVCLLLLVWMGSAAAASGATVKAAAVPSSTVPPVISGWPLTTGSILSGSRGSWNLSTPMTSTYLWKRCDLGGANCSVVRRGPASTYKLTARDVGTAIKLTVKAVSTGGTGYGSSVPTARIAPKGRQATPHILFGVHSDLTWYGDASQHAAVVNVDSQILRAQLSRNSFLWHRIEPTQGTRNWSVTDDVVDKLTAAGIEPEFTVYGSPSWANGVPASTSDYYLYVPQDPTAFKQWVVRYASFLQTAAARYAGKVNLWECGNEENEHYFWKPAPSVSQYLVWYRACRKAILAGNPQAKVAVGGLAGLLFTGPTDISGKSFLQQLIAAGAPIDHVAIHPYAVHGQSPAVHVRWDGNFDDIGEIRGFLDSLGLQNVDIWVTEWGWDSQAIGAQAQADYLLKSMQMLRTQFRYVTYAFYFCDFDRAGYDHGLLDANLKPKPAGSAFAQFMSGG